MHNSCGRQDVKSLSHFIKVVEASGLESGPIGPAIKEARDRVVEFKDKSAQTIIRAAATKLEVFIGQAAELKDAQTQKDVFIEYTGSFVTETKRLTGSAADWRKWVHPAFVQMITQRTGQGGLQMALEPGPANMKRDKAGPGEEL